MKVYLSCDIEGIAGICNWDETELIDPSSTYFKEHMSKEVNAACEGANLGGALDIFVKDAHGSARTINPLMLPENVRLLRGWSRDPHVMMARIDDGFDACAFVGYHCGSSQDGNPLSHTMDCCYDYVKINGRIVTEFMMNAYTSIYYNTPVVFVSGDKCLCEDAKELFPNIVTVAVSEGLGDSSTSIHPNLAIKKIREGMKEALSGDLSRHMISLPDKFDVEIKFRQHYKAYRASFYPGCSLINPQTISFTTNDYYEFLRMFLFI